ncbi:MAG: hypothetical protein VKJ64_00105 [Leptolyngbyaceae bacterium]|nr:hypothetical protein [Leptolyngbyaceae bacterium]
MEQSMQQFLYPSAQFHGSFSIDALIFDANLQEFAQRVGYISNLHTGGKLSSDEAFTQIQQLWEDLNNSQPLMTN